MKIKEQPQLGESEIAELARHMSNTLFDSRPGYMFNHWSGLYAKLHPKHTAPNSEARKLSMEVLNAALPYHLENTINANQQLLIQDAMRDIANYK